MVHSYKVRRRECTISAVVATRSYVLELQGQRSLCGEQSTCHQEKLSLDASATAGKISTRTCQQIVTHLLRALFAIYVFHCV